MKKRCGACTKPKPVAAFYKNRKRSDGLDWRCKKCSADAKAKFYLDNKDKIRARDNARYKANMRASLLKAAKMRAAKSGILFDITIEDVVIPKHCPVLGIELLVSTGKRDENSPSLDRVDNHKGYTKGNVCVISWRANRLKGDGTRREHQRIAAWMEEYEHSTD